MKDFRIRYSMNWILLNIRENIAPDRIPYYNKSYIRDKDIILCWFGTHSINNILTGNYNQINFTI